ncbi:MAG: SpiroCoCo family coiled-coil protein [Alkalispirochaeta sp.]
MIHSSAKSAILMRNWNLGEGNMGFTIGDIIVLLVVVVILAVYRQTDRNNRSLDKVKRFVERVQGEMDEIVAEKVTMLKDIGIEVDVHQKAAKEVLKRIQSIEDDLNSRTGSLEEIGARLTEYEQALSRLVEMTQRTEENIERVRDESEYVDKVGKRIKATQGKIEELERSLPGIVSGFEKQNDERLAELERRVLASTEKRVAELSGRIDGAGTRVQEFQEEVVRLQGETEERAVASRQELEQLHRTLLGDAREEIDAIAQDNRRDLYQQREEIENFLDEIRRKSNDVQEDTERAIAELRRTLAESVDEAEERLASLAEQARRMETESLAALRDYIDSERTRVREEFDRSLEELRESDAARLTALEEELSGHSREMENSLQQTRSRLLETITERMDGISQEAAEGIDTTGQTIRAGIDELNTLHGTESRRIRESYATLQEEATASQSEIERVVGALNERIAAEETRLSTSLDELRARYEDDRRQIEALGVQVESASSDLESRLASVRELSEAQIREMTVTLSGRVDSASQEVETRVLAEVEQRLKDYENELNYRFTKIERVNSDVDALEGHLRATMDRISERVRGDFLAFGEEIRELRERDKAEAESAMDLLRGAMGELETGLNELKQRAYDNVGEKLKVFEDEFFADLRERSDAMDGRITEWLEEVDGRLRTLQEEHTSQRNTLEQQYNEGLKSRLARFQETINAQLTKTDEQIDSFRNGLESRIEAVDEYVAGIESSMRDEVSSLQERSVLMFRQEFSQAEEKTRTELAALESEMEEQIAAIRGSVRAGTNEIEGMIESSRSDVAMWQTEVLNQLRSGSADVNNQLADAKVRLTESLQDLKREFIEEKEELIDGSQEERAKIRSELNAFDSTLRKLEDRIQTVSTDAIDEFEGRYRTIRQGIDDHESAIGERLDDRATDFRSLIDDTHGQFQAMREKLLGKLEEEARTLQTTLNEIDKRQKAFIEQTKVFERADTMKTALQESIENLREEISRVEAFRGEVREIEGQFIKIRKMSADVGEKMARFTADKRRIDLLEEDYKRLIGLAQSVEQKIEHVGSSEEQLQEITARLRSLDELQEEVEARFDRLEKRRGLIDQTTDSLEQNSQALTAIETRMNELTGRIETMPRQVEALAVQLKKVAAARKETDSAVSQLAKLEETLADVESRMQELQTAREWLARTETRLEEIRRDAGEQVKLLGSLMREETRKNPVDGGAPSMSARETVQKLAHQGWNVDEIARATKVSKGEVELILELTGKK